MPLNNPDKAAKGVEVSWVSREKKMGLYLMSKSGLTEE